MVDCRLAIALYLDHCGGLVGRDQWQARQSQREFILRELDFLAGLDEPRRERLRLQPGEATTTSGL